MSTKICTSIEQSKKLLSLGLDSSTADMEYISLKEGNHPIGNVPFVKDDSEVEDSAFDYIYNRTPCWSLTALLGVIPEPDLVQNSEKTWLIRSWINSYPWSVGGYSNPVDACYEMILELNKLNLL